MPSAGAVRLRIAISTSASARRWAEVRASSSRRGVRPRCSLASAQSASNSVVLQAIELSRDGRARDGVERHLPEPHPVDARLEVDVASGRALHLVGVRSVGVGQLLPVTERPVEVLESHLGGLGDEHRLIPGHGGLGAMPPGPGDRLGLVDPDLPVAPGPGAVGKVAERPPEAHPALRGTAGHPTAGRDPRGRRLGPVGGPLLVRLEGRSGLGDERFEASGEPVQLLHGGAVAVVGRPRCDEGIERVCEGLQLHELMEARSCDNSGQRNFSISRTIRAQMRPFSDANVLRGARCPSQR